MFASPHHGHPVVAFLIVALLVALLVLGIVTMVRMWRTSPGHITPTGTDRQRWTAVDPALNELRMRCARGDITAEEYWQRAVVLGYQVPPGSDRGSPPAGQVPPPGG